MKSLFEPSAFQEIKDRLNQLDENFQGLWGKMGVAQMLSHCKNPLEVALGKKRLKKPNFIMKLLYMSFKSAMYNDTPWKKNIRTPKEYIVDTEKNFHEEKTALMELISEFYELRHLENLDPHPTFGYFTHEQWGMLQHKHLDHHLTQFGV